MIPNPVVIFEHKGLYWSKIPGTEGAKTPEPDADYVIPFGKARMAFEADASAVTSKANLRPWLLPTAWACIGRRRRRKLSQDADQHIGLTHPRTVGPH